MYDLRLVFKGECRKESCLMAPSGLGLRITAGSCDAEGYMYQPDTIDWYSRHLAQVPPLRSSPCSYVRIGDWRTMYGGGSPQQTAVRVVADLSSNGTTASRVLVWSRERCAHGARSTSSTGEGQLGNVRVSSRG